LTTDPDTLRAARLLIEQHRDKAACAAARQAADCIACGDNEGVAMWQAILAAIV